MKEMDAVIDRILRRRTELPAGHSLLVGISGIDASGKGFVTQQVAARLALSSIAAAVINADGWLNLPHRRFDPSRPAAHFYDHAIRFDELFRRLLLPLREHRSIRLTAEFAAEAAREYRQHLYEFRNIDVILVEGIFLFKREHRSRLDLAVWVDCTFSTALERALSRKQEGLPPAETIKAYNNIYFPAQRIHADRDQPRESADLIINNDPYHLAGDGQGG